MKTFLRAVPLVWLAVSSACLVSRPQLPQPECEVDSQCSDGKICGPGGRCTSACQANADCAAPRVCRDGSCALPSGSCSRAEDCAEGQVCGVGYKCSKACTTAAECSATEACVASACTSLASGACRFTSECPSPQSCIQGRCAESCMDDRDCPFGTTCESNLCTPPAPGCLDATDCMTGQACSPQGDCVKSCTSTSECAASGEACSNGACVRVGADTAGLTGTVTLTGVSDASNLLVTIEGSNRATARTDANGAFTFRGLVPGLYRVTVAAPGTVEASASKEVAARVGMTSPVPAFTFTPAGSVSGTIHLAGRTSYEGIQIAALGTGLGTVTAPDGSFELRQLPVGTYDLLVAFSGYQAAQHMGLVVTYGQTTMAPLLTLQPVPSGSTFAFTSIPPSSTPIDQPFRYQALAGGGGVSAVTYALVDGPGGMTVNPNTGQVAWQPVNVGTVWIVLSATGGGATVYQLFYLTVDVAAVEISTDSVAALQPVDGGAWTIGTRLVFVTDAGTAVAPVPEVKGTVTSLEHLNGRTVTNYAYVGGTVTGIRGPIGTLNATWEGGVVASVSGVDVRTVQSSTLLGGTSGTATAPSGDTISALSWPTGNVTGIDDGRSTATGFRALTGIVGTVTSTGFTDAQAMWTPGTFDPLCVMNASGTARIGITSHTATTFTLDSDPTAFFAVGQRYFVGSCSGNYTTTYTFVDANRSSTPAASGRYIDVYASGLSVGSFALTATTPPPASTLSFTANISLYAALLNAATNGFYALGTSSGLDVLVTDSSAPWTATTANTNNFAYDDYSQAFDITSSTTTTLTVRQSFGSLLKNRVGRAWVLTNTSNNVQVVTTVTTGGYTPTALIGQSLWFDARGEGFTIIANTANTATVEVPLGRFPLTQLTGTIVGRSTYTYYLPGISVPSSGLAAGAYVGRWMVKLPTGSTPFNIESEDVIVSNAGTSFELGEQYCYSCVDGLALRLQRHSNVRWVPGSSYPRVEFKLAIGGSPNFPVDSLLGRTVVLESNRAAVATIVRNDASSVTVEVDESSFGAFRGLSSGERLWLSEAGNASVSPLKVKLVGQGATWTPSEWVGASVVASNAVIAGVVTANTATELDITVTSPSAFQALTAGSNFAFARAHVQGVACSSPGVWIRTTFTLAGATLAANAYTHVRTEYSSSSNARFQLFSNTTSAATAYLCASSYTTMLNMVGRAGVFDTNGRFNLTVDDSSASLTPNAHAGAYLYYTGNNGGRFGLPVTTNTATSFSVNGIDSYNWFFGYQDGFPFRVMQPGTSYVLTNSASEVPVTVTVTPALTAGELNGRWVHVNDAISGSNSSIDFLVGTNTANTVSLAGVNASQVERLKGTGSAFFKYLSLSRGTVLRLTSSGAALTPGALIGRTLRIGSAQLIITDNAATTITARAATEDSFGNASAASSWSVDVGGWLPRFSARVTGEALALRTDGRLAQVTPSGTVTWVTPFTGAQALTVRTSPNISGVLSNSASTGTYSTTWADSSWNFTPDQLINSYFRVQECGSQQANFLIKANTATSITAYRSMGCANIAAGWRYTIDSARLVVSGTTLTASALKGKRLWINGNEYLVRDNTTTDIQLVYPETYSSGALLDVVEAGGTAWVLGGPSVDDEPGQVAAGAGSDLWVGTGASVARFDGTAWVENRLGTTAATLRRTGTVSFASSSNVLVDTTGGLTPGSLSGKRLVMDGVARSISANTANSITLSSGWTLLVPVPGTSYQVYDADGFSYVQSLAVSGTTLWVGTGTGLYRKDASWTHFTQANTETSLGAADGLVQDDVERLRVLPNGDVFAFSSYQGASRLRGTTWTTFTQARSESAPGARDGLPYDEVNDVAADSAGNLWFATNGGAGRLVGTTWTHYGQAQGLTTNIMGVWIDAGGRVHLGNALGLYRIAP